MKKKGSIGTFILVVATLAAAAAIMVSRIDKICEILDKCKKTLEKSPGCFNFSGDTPSAEESDFEDVELI